LSILLGTNFTDNHLEDCRFVSLGFLNNWKTSWIS
jgi:hypothetical protein